MQYNKSYAIAILFHVLASTSQLSYDGVRIVSCPGEVVNFTCTVNGLYHLWMIESENITEYMHIQALPLNLYPRSHSKYIFDGFMINDNTMVTFLTFSATNGIINVTCEGAGDNNQQSLTAEVIG